ncbi:hypothetical protein JST97_33260 [bacterium]|nr:hypothetical protein [bacterium]
MRRRRGIALAVVMSLIVIMVLIALAVGSSGIATLNQAGTLQLSNQSVYAAEAGLAAAFREIVMGNSFSGYSNVPYGRESRYWVTATAGPAPAAPDHPAIPAGMAYLLATGTTRNRYSRRVGVLITGTGVPGASGGGGYAIAAGRRVEAQGNSTISGSIKASDDVRTQGSFKLIPFQGSGRIASGADLDLANNTRRDPSQELRARQTISIGPSTFGTDSARLIFPGDTTPASAPWIADGLHYTNVLGPSEVGEILPNPDPASLLGLTLDASGNYVKDASGLYVLTAGHPEVVQHLETDGAGLNLDNKIHLYINGFSISGSNAVSGKGTIVVGEGKDIHIQGNQTLNANLLALRWPSQLPSGGNPSIDIQGNVDVNGMILAHQNVDIQGNFNLHGMVIAYSGDVRLQGNKHITYDASGFNLPGLGSWQAPLTPPTGSGTLGITPGQPLKIISWQRL